jgi:hypothetical protein
MAQIIKHRRGSIDSVKNSTSRKGELIMATGSVGNLNGPFVFIGTDEGSGLYSPASKLYAGSEAPTLTATTYGTTLDGTPFYASSNKSLYILNNSNVGNSQIDLTGNIEGNTISGVTINNLQSTNVTSSYFTGAFVGDASGLFNIPASGVTNLDLSRIVSGSATASISPDLGLEVNVDIKTSNNLYVTGNLYLGDNTASQIYYDGKLFIQDTTSGVQLSGGNGSYLTANSDGYVGIWSDQNNLDVTADGGGNLSLWSEGGGNTNVSSYDGGVLNLNTDATTGDVYALNGAGNKLHVKGDIVQTGSLYTSQILGTGSLYLQPDQNDGRLFEIYNSAAPSGSTDIHFKGNADFNFFGDDINYLKIDDSLQTLSLVGVNGVFVSSSLNVNGNTSVTGALVVSNGSATFDSGLVAQNSNMLLTSGSNLIVQDGGDVQTDYLRGTTEQWNYLSLNGNGVNGQPGVELSSAGDISLWAEGGTVSVTGSLRVTGDIVFSGSINLGDYSGDTVNFNGEVSSSILPQTGSSFDLGSSGQTWNNVWAENAHFTNISLNSIAFDGLTEGRVVTVGASGSLVDYSGFTYSESNGFTMNTNGDVNINVSSSFNLYTHDSYDIYMSSSSDMTFESDNDVTITAGDDLRLYANDTFALRNYSSTDPIELVTNYNGSSKTMSFDINGNLTIPGGFTGSFANLSSGATITGSLIVSDGSGLFNSSLVANNSNLTLDNGSHIEMNEGHVYFNGQCGDIYYDTDDDQLVIFNDCGSIRFGSNVYTSNSMYFNDGNTLYTNYIYGFDGGNLDLGADGNVYIHSDNSDYVEIYADNSENGTNRLKVQQSGISLETYDVSSELTHKVTLNNLGNLSFENVQVGITGSMSISGSFDTYGPTHIHNDLYVSGNLAILGSGSVVHISASQVDIGTNIINLNTYAPFERFAGLAVYDSGSNAGVTGSLLWDSTNNVWIYSHPDHLGSVASARLISGPLNTGSLGDETTLSVGHFPIATGDDHISDSLLTYLDTTLALNTNKFTVDSDNGNMLINGNFTIEGVGSTDNGEYSSYIVFRNDSNVLGFVGTTDTGNVTDRLLGYNELTGLLEFSSLIDGGTY